MVDDDRPGDEPTQAYRPYQDDDATRLERPIPAYDPNREDPSLYAPSIPYTPGEQKKDWGLAAPLFTVALLSILLGLGLGYLLFRDTGGESPTSTTTTSAAVTSSSTSSSTTSTTDETTSTIRRSTTTTTEASTTSSTRGTSSSSSSSTSTTAD